jgi:hypothetical protein
MAVISQPTDIILLFLTILIPNASHAQLTTATREKGMLTHHSISQDISSSAYKRGAEAIL